ncbi:MBL fold metallo-hydrolase [Ktedonobacter racemifer]|uniref:Metallo-beta-lactamase domain-containing protein n=1 Tax=Ktedonobacter racemifer DSM 44963 TaxID=485913 RepID=D6TVA5_KTERA|nr:MBL fold metallo-hydrolase [Ktedonobacter racemifer]EFH84205.1 conserved hypothetical protein [Ktedonobacter racemifer DSM 44963]
MSSKKKESDQKRIAYVHRVVLPATQSPAQLEGGSIFFVGTATVLVKYAGFTFLTDPNFLHRGEYVHLGYGLRSKRLTCPGINLEELPRLDFVLLSHLHEDHFDRLVARKLPKNTPIVTTPKAASALAKKGFIITYPLNTWETFVWERGAQQLAITAMPGKHAPGPLAKLLPPVMGSMLEFQQTSGETLMRMYISGDTLYIKDLAEIPHRYPNVDLGLFHLGGTRVMGLMVTMDAKQGLKAIKLINPKTAIPIHYNDYTVFKSPLEDFQRTVEGAKLTSRVHYLTHGDSYTFQVPAERRSATDVRAYANPKT